MALSTSLLSRFLPSRTLAPTRQPTSHSGTQSVKPPFTGREMSETAETGIQPVTPPPPPTLFPTTAPPLSDLSLPYPCGIYELCSLYGPSQVMTPCTANSRGLAWSVPSDFPWKLLGPIDCSSGRNVIYSLFRPTRACPKCWVPYCISPSAFQRPHRAS